MPSTTFNTYAPCRHSWAGGGGWQPDRRAGAPGVDPALHRFRQRRGAVRPERGLPQSVRRCEGRRPPKVVRRDHGKGHHLDRRGERGLFVSLLFTPCSLSSTQEPLFIRKIKCPQRFRGSVLFFVFCRAPCLSVCGRINMCLTRGFSSVLAPLTRGRPYVVCCVHVCPDHPASQTEHPPLFMHLSSRSAVNCCYYCPPTIIAHVSPENSTYVCSHLTWLLFADKMYTYTYKVFQCQTMLSFSLLCFMCIAGVVHQPGGGLVRLRRRGLLRRRHLLLFHGERRHGRGERAREHEVVARARNGESLVAVQRESALVVFDGGGGHSGRYSETRSEGGRTFLSREADYVCLCVCSTRLRFVKCFFFGTPPPPTALTSWV